MQDNSPDSGCEFAIDGDRIITAEEHFGLKGFMLTASVPYRDVLSVRGLWAPPYASADFTLDIRLDGDKVPTDDYTWNGNECRRRGSLERLRVESSLALPMSRRGGMLEFTITNDCPADVTVPVQLDIRGGVDYVEFWEFAGPGTTEGGLPWCDRAPGWWVDAQNPGLLRKESPGGVLALSTDLESPCWEGFSGHWESSITLEPGESRTFHVAFAVGAEDAATQDCLAILDQGAEAAPSARREWAELVDELFTRVPRLNASDRRLVNFYNRSLVHLILNQWRVPEFVVSPYYSTGGINGGCVCCYLWDFGEPWEMLPLYDPAALKAHIKQFLAIDLTRHFAFVPTTGEAFGPWYPVNQEKIIFLVHYYVLFTGDVSFLLEKAAGKTILDWMLFHATYRDHPKLPQGLIDYGKGNNHLELRGHLQYNNYLPDLNLRRCANYLAAYELSRLAGQPASDLPQRAAALKSLVREMMWSDEDQWFKHLDENLQPDLRWTVQMFKLIANEALDPDQLDGLVSHLNSDEFLSPWGLHSMSKLDPAYDQIDIDNGGGGNYTAFTPQIIERLYKAGRPEIAEGLLTRILWWGERMPYWGDSIVANNIDYRHDTPLQNTIGSIAGAQAIIFGMFGVAVSPGGAITIDPRPPTFSPEISLTGLKIRGRCLDIAVTGDGYTVTEGDDVVRAKLGTPVVLPPADPSHKTEVSS